MHVHLSQVLDQEVFGGVTRVGDRFFDVGLGRVCLDRLSQPAVDSLVERLRTVFGDEIQVGGGLNLDRPRELVRGMVEVTLHDPELGNPYVLQITSKAVLSALERRFMLGPDEPADLGILCRGLDAQMKMERPLRLLSGYEELHGMYLEHLDAVMQAVVQGKFHDSRRAVEEMAEGVRRAWLLLPANLKARVNPIAHAARDRICEHDRSFQRTIIFAVDLFSGSLEYTYSHRSNPLEVYEQVLSWVAEIPPALQKTFQPPSFELVIGRGSSVQEYLEHFPGYQGVVGPKFQSEDAS